MSPDEMPGIADHPLIVGERSARRPRQRQGALELGNAVSDLEGAVDFGGQRIIGRIDAEPQPQRPPRSDCRQGGSRRVRRPRQTRRRHGTDRRMSRYRRQTTASAARAACPTRHRSKWRGRFQCQMRNGEFVRAARWRDTGHSIAPERSRPRSISGATSRTSVARTMPRNSGPSPSSSSTSPARNRAGRRPRRSRHRAA